MVLGALACAAVLAAPATAAEPEGDIEDALAVFSAKGSHGYSMIVLAGLESDEPVPPGGQRKGTAFVYLIRDAATTAAVYVSPATMTADFVEGRPTITSMHLSLGKQGQIALDFKPSGGTSVARHPRCDDGPIAYANGSYEGTIEFHGEEGFTDVSATRVNQRPQRLLDLTCRSEAASEVSGPRLPGAKLEAQGLRHGALTQLQVNQNRPGAPVYINAGVVEERGKVGIIRVVTRHERGGVFSWDTRLHQARLSPRAPFSGRGVYRRDAKAANRWSGNLAVDFPGRSNFRLTGRGLRAKLEHAVRRVTGHGPTGDRAARLLRAIAR